MAWLSGYTTRRRIVISHANVDADLTAFPVYVRLRSTNFNFAESTANGHDIRFTAADGTTLLSFERERHDQGAALADYMVRIPTLFGAVDTIIFMYFRTTSNTDLSAPNTVWDSNTVGRWSLAENPAGTAPQMRDSTANNNHGTTEGAMTAGQSVEGQSGRALSFDGVDDRVNVPLNGFPTTMNSITLDFKMFSNHDGRAGSTFMAIPDENTNRFQLHFPHIDTIFFDFGNIGAGGRLSVLWQAAWNNTWAHWTFISNAGVGMQILRNNVIIASSATTSSFTRAAKTLDFARNALVSWAGILDDVIISNVARSPAWIRASFHSGNNTLLTVEATEQAAFVYTGLSPVIAHSSFVQALSQNITGLSPIITMPDAPYVQALNYAGISPVVAVTRADNVFRYVRNGLTALEVAPSHILIASLPNVYEHFSSLFVTGHLSDLTQIAYGYAGQSIVFTAPIADRIFSHRIIGDGVFVVDFSGEVTISRLETNEFRFAGIPSSQYHVKMLKSPILVLPGTRDKILTIPGRHGTIRMPHDWQERTIRIECWLAASSMQELHDKLDTLRAWLGQGQQRLTLGYMPDRYYIATFAGGALEAEIKAHQGLFSLEFVCADPFLYNSLESEFNFTNSTNVTNAGTHPCDPVFRFTFTAAAAELRITLAGRQIRIVHNFQIGNVLDVNCVTGGVLIAGARAMDKLDWQNSEFFSLVPGSNLITLTPINVCSANVRYRERWL